MDGEFIVERITVIQFGVNKRVYVYQRTINVKNNTRRRRRIAVNTARACLAG